MTEVSYTRNPYPVPDVSREGIWVTRGPVLGEKVSPQDRNWDTKLNTHERLFAHHTLNSVRRDKRLLRPKVPNDALDLALTTVYAHSKDTLVPKTYVFVQPETLGRQTWRVLRNEVKVPPKVPTPSAEQERRYTYMDEKWGCSRGPIIQRRIHPCSVKLNIDGPHAVQTNPGYSRKIDGTFYSI
ncbi:hypothetical protein KM043_002377 [Ampulex compressa]|nr:hypothetical protein KM043_002377 [Ampulex compressa]